MEEIELGSLGTPLDASPGSRHQAKSEGKPDYARLPPKYIRVLDILPVDSVSGSDTLPIITRLRVINLENNSKFTALSYVWGTYAPEPNYITCDDIQFKVTLNCHSVLRHLRKKLGALTMWVDAVCINQDDVKEKETQIPLMGEIYTRAEVVYVWLGEGTAAKDRAMAYLSSAWFEQYHSPTESRPFPAALAIFRSRWSRIEHLMPLPSMKRPFRLALKGQYTTFNDLKELLASEWITRLWTYQEIILASNPIVVCGHSHLAWYHLERSLLFLELTPFFDDYDITERWTSVVWSRERLRSSTVASLPFTLSELQLFCNFVKMVTTKWERCIMTVFFVSLTMITTVLIIAGLERGMPQKIRLTMVIVFCILFLAATMFFVLARSYRFEVSTERRKRAVKEDFTDALYSRNATVSKDMAFGMWAVMERGGTNLPPPDYSNSVGDIYRLFTTRMSQFTHSLDSVLIAAARSSDGQPTWVPDWSTNRNHDWINSEYKAQTTDECGYYTFESTWHAFLHTIIPIKELLAIRQQPRFSFDTTEMILKLYAREIGKIRTCLHFQPTNETFVESERGVHLENLRLMLVAATFNLSMTTWLRNKTTTSTDRMFPISMTYTMKNRSMRSHWNELQTEEWVSFCKRRCHKDVLQTFNILQGDEALFRTHARLCNLLANQPRSLFIAHTPERPHIDIWGQCSRQTLADDRIVRVEGVPQLLIVRGYAEGIEKAVKIVSPVELLSIEQRERIWYRSKAVEVPLEEYHVY